MKATIVVQNIGSEKNFTFSIYPRSFTHVLVMPLSSQKILSSSSLLQKSCPVA
jgi:hypothetical protein